MSAQDATIPPTDPIPTATDARHALRCLARKGAYAAPHGSCPDKAGSDYAIHAAQAATQPLAIIPAGIVAQARSRGWLERDGDGRLRLSIAGIKVLRKGFGEPAGSPASKRQKKSTKAGAMRAHAQAAHESPLAWLRRRKDKDGQPLITEAQHAAGERLATDYRRAQISRRVTSDWSGAVTSSRTRRGAPGAGIDLSDAAIAARERVNRAIAAVGSELAGILIDICCHETGLEAAERAEGWPQRAAKVVLQLALTALARHYGLIAPEPAPFARLRHWGDEDYRPGIDAWR